MMTKKSRSFALLFAMLFCILLITGCVYTAAPSASHIPTETQPIDDSILQQYKPAPTDSFLRWDEEAYHHFYYIDGEITGKEFSYSGVEDIDFYRMTIDHHHSLILAKDLFSTNWEELMAAKGKVRVYFYLLGHSRLYDADMGLYCGFETLEDDNEIKPAYDDLQAAITEYTAIFVPTETEPPVVTVPDTGSPFPVYENGPYTVGKDMYEGLYLLIPEDYYSSYTITFPTDGYNRLLHSSTPADRYANPAFSMEYFQPNCTYTFNGITATLLSDFTSYWGSKLLNTFGKNKDGTFKQGTYQIGTMLSAGTYEIIPYDVEESYFYEIALLYPPYGLFQIDDSSAEIVIDGKPRVVTVEDGQFLIVQDAYIKPVKTTA